MTTIFGKIIRKEIPADLVFESERVLAFRDIKPQAPTHILIVPKKPIKDLHSATKEDQVIVAEMLLVAADLARAEGLTESGYRVVVNAGAFQEVPHLHFHLLGGRNMKWPPG